MLTCTAVIMDILLSLPSLLLLFVISISSLLLFFVLLSQIWSKDLSSYPPGLEPYPFIGHLPQFLKNRHRIVDWQTECLAASPTNTFVIFRTGGVGHVITANPANVEHMLRSNSDNYIKGDRVISVLHDFLGDGIFSSDGDTWRVQRKTASFEFNTKSLRSFVVRCVQQEVLHRLLPLLRRASLDRSVVDLQDVLERFAFDNICKVAFNHDPACLAQDVEGGDARDNFSTGFAAAFIDASVISSGRFRYAVHRFWMIKKLFGVGSERRLKEAIATVHNAAMQIIRSKKKERRASSSSSSSVPQAEDLLSRFVANEDHSEEFLRDIVINFMLAGKDTTSSALTWFFWLLSSRPEVEAKILDEIRSIRAQNPNGAAAAFDFEELREMHYLQAAITESMRLYPPVPFSSLTCLSDDVLPDGTAVKKGWFVSYTPYAMARMEAVWGVDCGEYKPERWLEAGTGAFRPESPFKYPVFHGGPRMCLGKEMAYIQMKSVAACVLEKFAVEVSEKAASPEKMVSLTLRMEGGLPVLLRPRESRV
ncbi:Cytochrome P450 [Canna indica]|uniref:Cytochrome P450 n=1 Tax=Canna indica TaxID=4628 RepID=A0AAQ3K7H0_9LILI|nr:Cytochrome P450 [Canna indica]